MQQTTVHKITHKEQLELLHCGILLMHEGWNTHNISAFCRQLQSLKHLRAGEPRDHKINLQRGNHSRGMYNSNATRDFLMIVTCRQIYLQSVSVWTVSLCILFRGHSHCVETVMVIFLSHPFRITPRLEMWVTTNRKNLCNIICHYIGWIIAQQQQSNTACLPLREKLSAWLVLTSKTDCKQVKNDSKFMLRVLPGRPQQKPCLEEILTPCILWTTLKISPLPLYESNPLNEDPIVSSSWITIHAGCIWHILSRSPAGWSPPSPPLRE